MLTRRAFLQAGGLGLLGSALYARFLEPGWPVLTRHRVPFFSSKGPSLRILHLSDLHYSPVVPLPFIEHAIRMGLEQQPDLVCLTGDYMTTPLPDFDAYLETFRKLAEHVPVLACLGNHDYQFPGKTRVPAEVKNSMMIPLLLKVAGVRVLENEGQTVHLRDRNFQVIGLGDVWRRQCYPGKAFARQQAGVPTLVLCHNPEAKSLLEPYPWELMLCGHTHGGQIKIPFFGALHAPIQDFKYIEGLNPWKKRWIYTTRGVGSLYGLRFNCRPEVSLVELV